MDNFLVMNRELTRALRSSQGLGAPPWALVRPHPEAVGILGTGWQTRPLGDGLVFGDSDQVLWLPRSEAARILWTFGRVPGGMLAFERSGGDRWRVAGPGGRVLEVAGDPGRVPKRTPTFRVGEDRLEALVWLWEDAVHPQEALERLARMGIDASPEEVALTYASLEEERSEGVLRGARLRRILRRVEENAGAWTTARFLEELARLKKPPANPTEPGRGTPFPQKSGVLLPFWPARERTGGQG